MFVIEEELKKLPDKSGVYLMHDRSDEIIYIGKAISLRKRVRQYFRESTKKTAKIEKMVSLIERFEYIITDSELEALVLECNLIKEHSPRYNTMLKDDKSYPYIKVTVYEDFPRVLFSRDMKKDRSRYFGPYTSSGAVKDTIDLIHKLYHLRTCNRSLPRDIGKERPCLNYHIKQCDAPCQGYIDKAAYAESVNEALSFLKGNYEPVLCSLGQQMKKEAEALQFEEAAETRELLFSVQKIAQKQKITDSAGEDRDVLAFARDGKDVVLQVFFVRGGKLIGRDHFHLEADEGGSNALIMSDFIKQFYSGTPYIPHELFLQYEVEEEELLASWLSARRGQKVIIRVPRKGEKARLVELAARNAAIVLQQDKEKMTREEARTKGAVAQLGSLLGLEKLSRMEAYDISNISGFASVGSMVVYEGGRPRRSDYRKFRIKSVSGPNDYASMEEVLTRRFEHGLRSEDFDGFNRFPDLILMDGGKGQVNIAERVLESIKLNIPVCGMVKDDKHRTRGLYYHNKELMLDTHSECFRLLTRIQDEAHRFAIEYHKSMRSKGQVHSILDDIPNVGPARRKALMRYYTSLEDIKKADVEELKKIPEMNEKAAKSVVEFFKQP